MEAILPACLGLVTGVLLGLTGAGGGILAAPMLIVFLQLPLAKAAPISLIAVALSAGIGAAIGLRQGAVRYRAALLMAGVGLLAAPVGIHLSKMLPNTPLVLAFSALLAFQAWNYWRVRHSAKDENFTCRINGTTGQFLWNRQCALMMARSGLAAGFLSGLLGVGGGFILVPALRKHTPLSMHSATSTSLMVLAVVSTGGLLQWLASTGVDWDIGWPFVVGAVAGMAIARAISSTISDTHVRRIFAAFCLLGSLMLAFNAIQGS